MTAGNSISVIIPTRDRPAELEAAVASLFGQTVLPAELIVVDQSSGAEAQRRIEARHAALRAEARARLRLRYVRDPSISGGAVGRNCAMDMATGDIWVFLDDDVVLEPDFLEQLLAAYARHPHAAGVSGIITNYQPPSRPIRLWTRVFVRGPFHDDRQPVYWNAERLRNAEPIPVSRFGAGLMSLRADAVGALRFDENLRGVSDGEDVDLCMRLGRGALLLIAPRARLAHHHSPTGRLQDHWLRRDARTAIFLYGKNWRHGIRNRLCAWWLAAGMALLAAGAAVRRRSAAPWQALVAGVREGRAIGAAAAHREAERQRVPAGRTASPYRTGQASR